MAVPKRRTSRANTRHRRAHWLRARAPQLVTVVIDGERVLVPHRLVRHYRRQAAQR